MKVAKRGDVKSSLKKKKIVIMCNYVNCGNQFAIYIHQIVTLYT